MICLDTTFIIDLLKKREEAYKKFQELKDRECATTLINIYELKIGAYRKLGGGMTSGQLEVINNLMAFIKILPLDALAVEQAAKINAELMKKGELIDDLDILIGGICMANNCKLIITKNKWHFDRIHGLKVEGY
ncbi:MAG TPA: type II toxin-antitoxin system VapC family toxin [Candidatus Nanoarchaeia archaeon]|nr:type II toxin-antitoxin system VapC family toxin [Candidatus Nanoarchaeia archaeon]